MTPQVGAQAQRACSGLVLPTVNKPMAPDAVSHHEQPLVDPQLVHT